jgi:anti-sigma B factor antagonist
MDLTESFPITSERTGDGYRLAPTGELDIATVPLLEAAFDEIGAAPVLLDLEGVTFIDSTGLQLLLRISDRGDGRVEMVSSPALERLLEITGVRDRLPLRA